MDDGGLLAPRLKSASVSPCCVSCVCVIHMQAFLASGLTPMQTDGGCLRHMLTIVRTTPPQR
jgi:hypothetical protein